MICLSLAWNVLISTGFLIIGLAYCIMIYLMDVKHSAAAYAFWVYLFVLGYAYSHEEILIFLEKMSLLLT